MQEVKFKLVHSLPTCIKKTFDILGNIACETFEVEFLWKRKRYKQIYTPPDKIVVSDNLYRQYNCLDYKCSRCCWKIRHWNVFTPSQYRILTSEFSQQNNFGQRVNIKINGQLYCFYTEDNTQTICRHLNLRGCGIHKSNPIHCALPLIKFRRVLRNGRVITYVTREPFTRNWFMQCPVKFKPIDKKGFEKTLWVLGRIKTMTNELRIKTSINNIIRTVRARQKEYV